MNTREKTTFVNEFIGRMTSSILAKVAEMPEEWDGHELREYIGEAFYAERTILMRHDRQRMRAYRNECRMRNL